MNVIAALLARDRGGSAPALRTGVATAAAYDYRRLGATARKVGNFLRYLGVDEGSTVGVAADPAPPAVLSFLGAALLGARTRFDPPRDTEARALVAPVETVAEYDVPPGSRRVAYGGPPDDPAVAHFERDVWSENAAFPEADVATGAAPALTTGDATVTHAELAAAANRTVDRWALAGGDAVALRAGLADPRAVAAGVVAPLLAGGTVILAPTGPADVAVADGGATEARVIDVADVRL